MKCVTLAFCVKMRCLAGVRGATGRRVDLAPDEEGNRYEGSCQSCRGKVGNELRGRKGGLSCPSAAAFASLSIHPPGA